MPEQKISRVLFPSIPQSAGLRAMIIYLGPLSPKDSSDLPGSYPSPSAQDESLALRFGMKRATSPSLLGLALRWGLPRPVLPRERVVSYTTFSPLPLDPAKAGLGAVCFLWHFPSLQGESFRMNPYGPTCYVAPCPEPYGSGLALESSDFPPPPPKAGEAIIYSALAKLTDLHITFPLNAN